MVFGPVSGCDLVCMLRDVDLRFRGEDWEALVSFIDSDRTEVLIDACGDVWHCKRQLGLYQNCKKSGFNGVYTGLTINSSHRDERQEQIL